ncbi:hypothetical protein [Lysobacter tyrosinilyticus]
MSGTFHYRAFGLNVASELLLPELLPAEGTAVPDLRIRQVGSMPLLATDEPEHEFTAVAEGGYVMRVEDVGHYRVRAGTEIDVWPYPEADAGLVRLYLNGSAMGFALHQQGALVMHASAVLRGGAATLFVGDSGAGKSTLAARFGQAGFAVLGDDITPIRLDASGNPSVWPGSTSFKLWEDALPALRVDRHGLDAIANRTDKFYVTNTSHAADQAWPVREIVVLEVATDSSHRLELLPRLHAIGAIAGNTYCPEYIGVLGNETTHFRQCAQIAAQIPVLRLVRPWDADRIDDTLEFLEHERPS